MKNNAKTKILSAVILFALWIPPCFELEIFSKTYVFFAAFSLSTMAMYIFKKEWISLIVTAVITIAVSLYKFEYIFLVLPIVFLMYAHRSIKRNSMKKDKEVFADSVNTYTTLSFVCIIGEMFYDFVQYNNIPVHRIENVFVALKIMPLFLVLFAILLIQSRKKENYKIIPQKRADEYTMIYATSLFGLVISLFTFHALNGYGTQSMRTEYLFWFIYVLTIGLNEDPFIDISIKRLEVYLRKSGC